VSLQKLFQISTSAPPPLHCTNPACPQPRNSLGHELCESCQTPLTYRYLWATGAGAAQLQPGELVGNRYYVTCPQVWLDTKPGAPPLLPDILSESILSYLYLHPYRLHLPGVFGVYSLGVLSETGETLLLDNIPVDCRGQLFPTLVESWPKTNPVRQVYWLWQMLQLWAALTEQGAAYSLLVKDNLRVEGWRVRLRELHQGKIQPTQRDLAESWTALIETAHPTIQYRLQSIHQLMRHQEDSFKEVASQLNQLLMEQAAQLPLHLAVTGLTNAGVKRSHNEDSCYPHLHDVRNLYIYPNDKLIPHLSMVCDGVGGHDGGEVASQLAVQSLKPLIHSLIAEISTQEELAPPELIMEQLQEIARVVNNVIAAQNNEQGREFRQRMGTTLVMALQLPQKVITPEGVELNNCHELYILNIGDSRAYWITQNSCQQLTVDDDVANREVRHGRSLYWDAAQRSSSGALTQALGTREAEFLRPTVQRFIIEEEGLLLLCSDGLSDNERVEQCWQEFSASVLNGEQSLESAVQGWIDIANSKNGHDNVSVVLTYFGVSPQKLVLVETTPLLIKPEPLETEPTEASKVLLYDESVPEPEIQPAPKSASKFKEVAFILTIFAILIAGGFGVWWQVSQSQMKSIPEQPITPSR
jgi:protein phosphatase